MATAGETLTNPVTGETISFRKTAADTNGRYLEVDIVLAPGAPAPGRHVHPGQEERFEVLRGALTFRYGRQTLVAEAGETLIVPAGKAHDFANASEERDARVRVTFRPALATEKLLVASVELAAAGRVDRRGRPNPEDVEALAERFAAEVEMARRRSSVVRAITGPLRRASRPRYA